jgi:hypothetical protein
VIDPTTCIRRHHQYLDETTPDIQTEDGLISESLRAIQPMKELHETFLFSSLENRLKTQGPICPGFVRYGTGVAVAGY